MKEKLLILPICLGLALLVCAWYLSYPLSIHSPLDFIFNHISPLYWIGLAIFLGSLYVAATIVKNPKLTLIVCVIIVMSMYSLRFFYYTLPNSDANQTRGLVEYVIETGDLNSSKPYHEYFQWSSFFILNEVTISISGLGTISFEFLLFTIIGLLNVLCLYVYASKFSNEHSNLAIIAYFLVIYWFLNYQFAPFSLAAGLLLTMFTIETFIPRNRGMTLVTLVLFTSVAFMHPFVAVFFITYTLVMYVIDRNRRFAQLFLLTLVIYLIALIFYTQSFFPDVVKQLTSVYLYEYQQTIERTFAGRLAPVPSIEAIAVTISRAVAILAGAIAGMGFLVLLYKRKLRQVDSAIIVSAAAYSLIGAVLPILGARSWFLLFIPVSLGVTFFSKTRYRKHILSLFAVLLVLFTFVLVNSSFFDVETYYQTKDEYQCASFLVNEYNWTKQSAVLSHYRFITYIATRTSASTFFGHDLRSDFPNNTGNYDCIVYTIGLGKHLFSYNYSLADLVERGKYNTIFTSDASYVITKATSKNP